MPSSVTLRRPEPLDYVGLWGVWGVKKVGARRVKKGGRSKEQKGPNGPDRIVEKNPILLLAKEDVAGEEVSKGKSAIGGSRA